MSPHVHTCPGHCGREVFGVFACASCTRRLPRGIRMEINATYWMADWPAHAQALLAGLHFYAGEPRPSVHSGESGESA